MKDISVEAVGLQELSQSKILVLSFKLLIQSSGQKPRPGPSNGQTEILVTCGHK